MPFNRALDMGTGTGFIAIYLTSLNYRCDASDINPTAIAAAQQNARQNNCSIRFYQSDMYESIDNKYDLIIWNLPYGQLKSPKLTKILEFLKSLLPRENNSLAKLWYRIISKQRLKNIHKFLEQSKAHSDSSTKILMLVHINEIPLLHKCKFKQLDTYQDMILVTVSLSHKST